MPRTPSKVLGAFAVLILSGSMLQAQATRTWVSGVGDDANPCSRTAPCKTFAGAISKTATGGEINVLDPAGFGGVTITKSISIINDGVGSAGVLVSGTNAIIVNAPAGAAVVLRGLDIEGLGTGLAGVKLLAGGSLTIENCTINNFAARAIDYQPNAASQLTIRNSIIRNNVNGGTATGGIFIKPNPGPALVTIDNVKMERNSFGVHVEDNAKVVIRDSTIAGSTNDGVIVTTASIQAFVSILNTSIINNGLFASGSGITTNGAPSVVHLNGSQVIGNFNGLVHNTGKIFSHTSNVVNGSASSDGLPFDSVLPQQ